ncbi:hypothetical protein Leryth_026455 [Lithospermum erythrorhizon]|nr:hypothetical protein Leryth_026455 [Lithospermum erythrorhizon]
MFVKEESTLSGSKVALRTSATTVWTDISNLETVVFAGFSAESLAQRIVDCKPKVILTCNAVKRGPSSSISSEIVDAALARILPEWCRYRERDNLNGIKDETFVAEVTNISSLIVLKGVLHTTGGYMVYTTTTLKYAFDYKPSDVYWYGVLQTALDNPTQLCYIWTSLNGATARSPLPGAWPQKPGSATFPFLWGLQWRRMQKRQRWLLLANFMDDVINVSGHRIGTAEVESALVSHPQCAEAAVVGVEHEVKGQGIYAFVTLVEGVPYSEDLRKSLVTIVRTQIGAFAAPDRIHWAPGLPKTRSGKIMRRILRKIASRQLDELGDTSTLADPGVVEQLIALADT